MKIKGINPIIYLLLMVIGVFTYGHFSRAVLFVLADKEGVYGWISPVIKASMFSGIPVDI